MLQTVPTPYRDCHPCACFSRGDLLFLGLSYRKQQQIPRSAVEFSSRNRSRGGAGDDSILGLGSFFVNEFRGFGIFKLGSSVKKRNS